VPGESKRCRPQTAVGVQARGALVVGETRWFRPRVPAHQPFEHHWCRALRWSHHLVCLSL